MVHYLCPFCYVAPVPTQNVASDPCFVCRNTQTLREANHGFEAATIADNLKTVCISLGTLDDTGVVSHQNSIKCIESEMSMLSDTFSNAFNHLTKQIATLQMDVHQLSSCPSPSDCPKPTKTAIDDHDEFLKGISAKLDLLCADDNHTNNAPTSSQFSTAPLAPEPLPPVEHGQTSVTDIKLSVIDDDTAYKLVTTVL